MSRSLTVVHLLRAGLLAWATTIPTFQATQAPYHAIALEDATLYGAAADGQEPAIAEQQEEADSEGESEGALSPLHAAVRGGKLADVKLVHVADKTLLNSSDPKAYNPLDYAAPGGQIYRWLKKRGAQHSQQFLQARVLAEASFPDGTPLHLASRQGDLEAVKKAVKANPDHWNYRHPVSLRTPILEAAANKQWAVVRWLSQQQEVWLDVADSNGQSLWTYVYKGATADKAAAALLPELLRRRTVFPMERINQALAWFKCQTYDFLHGKPRKQSETACYDQCFEAVALLVGEQKASLRKRCTTVLCSGYEVCHGGERPMRQQAGGVHGSSRPPKSFMLFTRRVAARRQCLGGLISVPA